MTLRATLRLQLHAHFDFKAATQILPYCAEMGISHLYLSPLTQARPGSPHGYDVIDPTRISRELGGISGLRELARQASRFGLALIADIVPNHMAADARNPWWRDVLRRGEHSPYAPVFDIDWKAGEGRVLLPILAQPYADALRGGDVRLQCPPGQAPTVQAGNQSLPVTCSGPLNAEDYDPLSTTGLAHLHQLLERQPYRLAWWRTASEQLNYRRFFEISGLVGVRVEDPAVFQLTHARLCRLYADGVVDGFRIDHVDGLAAPGAYLRRLRASLQQAAPDRIPYLTVEKILAPDETLDARWPVQGTTGYDFMDDVGALLHAPSAQAPLTTLWRALSGTTRSVDAQIRQVRADILRDHLVTERLALLRHWRKRAALDWRARDWGERALARVIDGWLIGFSNYRTYAEDGGPSAADRRAWARATRYAQRSLDPSDVPLLDLWSSWLAQPWPGPLDALRRLQQITPPLAAKSLEDTFFYRHGLLLSRNEVGGSPQRFSLEASDFHQRNGWRARHQPQGMLCTATHDHKRGEDARARLAVLTEIPQRWERWARHWMGLLPASRYTLADRYQLLQTLVGAWPVHWGADIDAIAPDAWRQWLARIGQWQTKALREAKQHTSWATPDAGYEADALACLSALAPDATDSAPLRFLAQYASLLVAPGLINSAAQTVLRNTAPGVPDLYQGAQGWDFSLVDPDNRHTPDWATLANQLHSAPPRRPDAGSWRSGRVKLHLIQSCLRLRAQHPDVFDGGYQPLFAQGSRAAHIVAYLRGDGLRKILVIVPRLCTMHLSGYAQGQATAACTYWTDTALTLPADAPRHWVDLLAGRRLTLPEDGSLVLRTALRHWPVALCISDPEGGPSGHDPDLHR